MFSSQWLSLCFITLLSGVFSAPAKRDSNSSPTVTIKNGTVKGFYHEGYDQDFFLGIPYAQPPSGNLRYRKPVPVNETWGTLDATWYGDVCMAHGGDDVGYTASDGNGYAMSEDCLSLNVVRSASTKNDDKLPVMLWIHGGGFVMGSSADVRYNLSFIVNRSVEMETPIIAVSINYRLSVWGFLGGNEIYDAGLSNLGLWDQRLALHWVQENIAAFGGDPTKVTIWGESAGAMSVSTHLIAFGGRNDGLFRAAIMESGSATTEFYPTPDTLQPSFDAIAEAVGCGSASSKLDCLRTVDIDLLFNATGSISYTPYWTQVVIDNEFLQGYPSTQISAGKFVKVPILHGNNRDEGFGFGPFYPINNDTQIVEALKETTWNYTSQEVLQTLVSLYSDDLSQGCPYDTGYTPSLKGGLLNKKSDSIWGDLLMVGIRRNFVKNYADHGVDAFSYQFEHLPWYGEFLVGVSHFVETPFVFDNQVLPLLTESGPNSNPTKATANPLGTNPGDLELAKIMQSQWISFAVNLTPNKHGISGVPTWPSYKVSPDNFIFRNSTEGGCIVKADNYRSTQIAWINSHGSELGR